MRLSYGDYILVLRITEHTTQQDIEDYIVKVLDRKMENLPQGKTWGLLSKEELKALQLLLAMREEVVDALLLSLKAFILHESLSKKMEFVTKINSILKEKGENLEISLFKNENGGIDPLNVISCYLEYLQRVSPVDDIQKIKQNI